MESCKKVHVWIVRMPEERGGGLPRAPRTQRAADPVLAGLIARLQAEVRQERQAATAARRSFGCPDRFQVASPAERAEAEITWRDAPIYFTECDFDYWERSAVPKRDR
jgi:hypothetical protein